MTGPEHAVRVDLWLRLTGTHIKAERVADLGGSRLIHQLQGFAGAVLEFLESPAANRAATVGDLHVIDGGIECPGFLGGGRNDSIGGRGTGLTGSGRSGT